MLDLRQNKIATVDSIKPLLSLAIMHSLILIGNPVAGLASGFTEVLPQVSAMTDCDRYAIWLSTFTTGTLTRHSQPTCLVGPVKWSWRNPVYNEPNT